MLALPPHVPTGYELHFMSDKGIDIGVPPHVREFREKMEGLKSQLEFYQSMPRQIGKSQRASDSFWQKIKKLIFTV